MTAASAPAAPHARGTAHGKVILFGEHAVVYGVPALAVGIDRGAWAEARAIAGANGSAEAPASVLYVRGWDVTVTDRVQEGSPPLARALRDVLIATREAQLAAGMNPVGAVSAEAEADLPPGGGLGCSAALGVALARAIDPTAAADAIGARVQAWERVFHGNPSGIDVAVASRGGCVMFTRTPSGAPSIEPLSVPATIHLCIGHTGRGSSTKAMVESVARKRELEPEKTQRAFDGIGAVVELARRAMGAGDVRALGRLLDDNQRLLSELGLSTGEIDQLCGAAREAGAFGAKLTGAGGGGCVVALVEDRARGAEVLAAWKRGGFEGFSATVGSAPRTARDGQEARE